MTAFDDNTELTRARHEARHSAGPELSWPERIEHYRRTIKRSAYIGFEDGWAYGVWFLGNSWAVASGYYGGYPAGYLKRLRALFPDKQRVLHLFSGRVNVAEFPGDTCDINTELAPTFVADAHTLEGVRVEDYDLILADPPYSVEDADHYGTPLVNRNKVVAALAPRMRLGAHLAWLDQARPMYRKDLLQPEAAIGIVRSNLAAHLSGRRRSSICLRPRRVPPASPLARCRPGAASEGSLTQRGSSLLGDARIGEATDQSRNCVSAHSVVAFPSPLRVTSARICRSRDC